MTGIKPKVGVVAYRIETISGLITVGVGTIKAVERIIERGRIKSVTVRDYGKGV